MLLISRAPPENYLVPLFLLVPLNLLDYIIYMWREAVLRCLTGRSDWNRNEIPDSHEIIAALQAKLKVYHDKELKKKQNNDVKRSIKILKTRG